MFYFSFSDKFLIMLKVFRGDSETIQPLPSQSKGRTLSRSKKEMELFIFLCLLNVCLCAWERETRILEVSFKAIVAAFHVKSLSALGSTFFLGASSNQMLKTDSKEEL